MEIIQVARVPVYVAGKLLELSVVSIQGALVCKRCLSEGHGRMKTVVAIRITYRLSSWAIYWNDQRRGYGVL